MIPFVYVIRHVPSGNLYVGARYCRASNPNDLWESYFTSSKVVKRLIEQDGVDSFVIVELLQTNTRQEALELEGQLQLKYPKEALLNRRLNNSKFNTFGPFSAEHCAKISEAKKGVSLLAQRGKKKSPESIAKMAASKKGQPYRGDRVSMALKVSASLAGRPKTEEHRKRLSEAKTGRLQGPQHPDHVAKRVASRLETLKHHGQAQWVASEETKEKQRTTALARPRVKCPVCDLLMTKQNLQRHEAKCKGVQC